jgi:hypothetical protein
MSEHELTPEQEARLPALEKQQQELAAENEDIARKAELIEGGFAEGTAAYEQELTTRRLRAHLLRELPPEREVTTRDIDVSIMAHEAERGRGTAAQRAAARALDAEFGAWLARYEAINLGYDGGPLRPETAQEVRDVAVAFADLWRRSQVLVLTDETGAQQ